MMRLFLGFALLLVLVACQTPIAIVLGPEVAGLQPLLEAQKERASKASGHSFVFMTPAEALSAKPAQFLVISSNDTLDAKDPKEPITFGLASGTSYSTAAVWTRELRESDGRWRKLPLFFDVPGYTRFSTNANAVPDFLNWSKIAQKTPILIAGASPRMRSLVWFGVTGTDALPGEQDFQKLSAWLVKTPWSNDTWRFTRADLDVNYHQGVADFLETFRDFYRANPPGFRTFTPLAGSEGKNLRVVGRLVTLQAFGTTSAQEAAAAWATILVSRALQGDYSHSSGWMPAEFSSPVLETASASVRALIIQATDFRATSSLTPEVLQRLDTIYGSSHSPANE